MLVWSSQNTYANDLVFSTGRKIPAIRAEADTTNVQVAFLISVVIRKMTDLLSTVHIEDLCATVATSSNKLAILTEANTAHHALMRQIMHQIDVKAARHTRIEYSVPIIASALEVWWKLIRIVVG